jgi:kynureninase
MLPIREKSLKLTAYLEFLLKRDLSDHVDIFTPPNPEERGAQLSVIFKTGDIDEIFDRLQAAGIVSDKRKPNIMRLSPAPLYNTFSDVFSTVQELKRIVGA